MLMPLILLGGAGLFFFSQKMGSAMGGRLYGLGDIDPSLQGGTFKTDFDMIMESAADKTGVPFALIKAHATIESSLNPNAYRDENPDKKPERLGWASRGLMQILWADDLNNPKATKKLYDRFSKYGYPGKDMGVSGVRMFEPYVNIDIASQLIRENLIACNGNMRDAINMYNAGVKESVRAAPDGYVNKVVTNYNKIIGGK